jgi:hypothetical protein
MIVVMLYLYVFSDFVDLFKPLNIDLQMCYMTVDHSGYAERSQFLFVKVKLLLIFIL